MECENYKREFGYSEFEFVDHRLENHFCIGLGRGGLSRILIGQPRTKDLGGNGVIPFKSQYGYQRNPPNGSVDEAEKEFACWPETAGYRRDD
jgi:hypothetical protein